MSEQTAAFSTDTPPASKSPAPQSGTEAKSSEGAPSSPAIQTPPPISLPAPTVHRAKAQDFKDLVYLEKEIDFKATTAKIRSSQTAIEPNAIEQGAPAKVE